MAYGATASNGALKGLTGWHVIHCVSLQSVMVVAASAVVVIAVITDIRYVRVVGVGILNVPNSKVLAGLTLHVLDHALRLSQGSDIRIFYMCTNRTTFITV
jgi:hypothetical protein